MPSNKAKVASYLDDVEKDVFDKFCDKHDYSNSEGVSHLIREQLMREQKMTAIDEEKVKLLVNSIVPLEQIEKSTVFYSRQCEKIEKLEELLAKTQEEVSQLRKEILYSPKRSFSDDDIADITGQAIEKVSLWRKGLQKPRGRRVLEKLRPYEVVHGQWQLRNRIVDSKNVT